MPTFSKFCISIRCYILVSSVVPKASVSGYLLHKSKIQRTSWLCDISKNLTDYFRTVKNAFRCDENEFYLESERRVRKSETTHCSVYGDQGFQRKGVSSTRAHRSLRGESSTFNLSRILSFPCVLVGNVFLFISIPTKLPTTIRVSDGFIIGYIKSKLELDTD